MQATKTLFNWPFSLVAATLDVGKLPPVIHGMVNEAVWLEWTKTEPYKVLGA